jgi:hypothetical protein
MEHKAKAYISELAQTELAKGSDDLTTDFVGDVKLHHAHVRRAEGRVLFGSHGDELRAPRTLVQVVVKLVVSEREDQASRRYVAAGAGPWGGG